MIEKYEKKKITPVKGIDESCSPISLMISNSPINLRHDQILEKEIIVKEINPFNNDENWCFIYIFRYSKK